MPATPGESSKRGFIIPIGGAEGKGRKPVILSRFVELCGGSDARIMVIPTASLLNETGPQYQELFESMGANAMCVPVERRDHFVRELDLVSTLRTRGVTLFFNKTMIAVAGERLVEPKVVEETFPLRKRLNF